MFTVCSTESQLTVTVIGIQFILRNTVGTVLARVTFTWRLKILNKIILVVIYNFSGPVLIRKQKNCRLIENSYPWAVMMAGNINQ